MNSGEESVTFLESGASFPDYDNIFTGDNRSYYDTSSPGMGSTRRPIPSGYKVAKDRSNGKNGKFIIVPEDKSLLPDGAEVKSDGRGGWILTAPESAYKENGNLNLKEDPNLYKKTRYYNKIDIDVSYDRKAINEIVVDESIGIYNPNDLSTSFENTLSMPSKEYEMKNYIYNDNSVFTYETFDDKNLNGEKNENKQELLNKISGYGK